MYVPLALEAIETFKDMPFSFASPEELNDLQQALDAAWAIVERQGMDPLKAPGERERLAHFIATLWIAGDRDDLVGNAVKQYSASWRGGIN